MKNSEGWVMGGSIGQSYHLSYTGLTGFARVHDFPMAVLDCVVHVRVNERVNMRVNERIIERVNEN